MDGGEVTGTLAGGVACTGTFSAGGRWCDNGNGTVTDTTTGLVWMKNWSNFGSSTAYDVFSSIDDSQVGGVSATTWRPPTRKEIEGIFTGDEPVSASTPRLFIGIASDYYWILPIDFTSGEPDCRVIHMGTGDVTYKYADLFYEGDPGAAGDDITQPPSCGIGVHDSVTP